MDFLLDGFQLMVMKRVKGQTSGTDYINRLHSLSYHL